MPKVLTIEINTFYNILLLLLIIAQCLIRYNMLTITGCYDLLGMHNQDREAGGGSGVAVVTVYI